MSGANRLEMSCLTQKDRDWLPLHLRGQSTHYVTSGLCSCSRDTGYVSLASPVTLRLTQWQAFALSLGTQI